MNYVISIVTPEALPRLEELPFDKITVAALVKRAGVSPNTFYYHYQDIPSLLEEIIIEAANTLTQQHDTALSMETCI